MDFSIPDLGGGEDLSLASFILNTMDKSYFTEIMYHGLVYYSQRHRTVLPIDVIMSKYEKFLDEVSNRLGGRIPGQLVLDAVAEEGSVYLFEIFQPYFTDSNFDLIFKRVENAYDKMIFGDREHQILYQLFKDTHLDEKYEELIGTMFYLMYTDVSEENTEKLYTTWEKNSEDFLSSTFVLYRDLILAYPEVFSLEFYTDMVQKAGYVADDELTDLVISIDGVLRYDGYKKLSVLRIAYEALLKQLNEEVLSEVGLLLYNTDDPLSPSDDVYFYLNFKKYTFEDVWFMFANEQIGKSNTDKPFVMYALMRSRNDDETKRLRERYFIENFLKGKGMGEVTGLPLAFNKDGILTLLEKLHDNSR